MSRSYLISSLLVALVFCGCATRSPNQVNDTGHFHGSVQKITRQFNGKVGNGNGDGQVVAINSECRGFGRGQTDTGRYYAQFDLTPSSPDDPPTKFQLSFIFPASLAGQVLITNTEAHVIDVWLFKRDANYANGFYVAKDNEEQLRQRGGEKMSGKVAVKWNSDADFVIGVDLVLPGDKSTWVRGEFVGSSKAKLNPLLYEWPAIVLFQESK